MRKNLLWLPIAMLVMPLAILLASCASSPPAVTPLPKPRPPLPPMPGAPTELVAPKLKLAKTSTRPVKLRLTRFMLGGVPAVTLAWDASTDTTVTSYNIYQGVQSRVYTNTVNAGLQTSITITNLVPNTQYYFAATAVAANVGLDTLESDYSAEVAYLASPPPSYIVGVQLLTSDSPEGPWKVYATLPSVSVPSSVNPTFFQSLLTITNQ